MNDNSLKIGHVPIKLTCFHFGNILEEEEIVLLVSTVQVIMDHLSIEYR